MLVGMVKPVTISSSDFELLEGATSGDEVARRFALKFRNILAFLNNTSLVHDLQADRKSWASPKKSSPAFESIRRAPQHWYTYHYGGRNEAQLNIGMFANEHQHVRIGLGFEGTTKEHGDPSAVAFIYNAFSKLLASNHPISKSFRALDKLEVEYWNLSTDRLELVAANDAIDFIIKSKAHFSWIFIGRILRRHDDAHTLSNPGTFAAALNRTLQEIRPIWGLANKKGRAESI
jgi:hypothetical protein